MCKNSSVFMVKRNRKSGELSIFRSHCKQWDCAECGDRKLRRHRAKVINCVAKSEGNFQFITLTSHEKIRDLQAGIAIWRNAWPRLRKRIARIHDYRISYVWIPEQHLDGALHIHMLTDTELGLTWLKKNARACGLGYIADVQPVKSAGLAAWYVTKYLSKNMQKLQWPRGVRRISYSRNWPKLDVENQGKSDCEHEYSIILGDSARAEIKWRATRQIETAGHVELFGKTIIDLLDLEEWIEEHMGHI